MKLFLNFGLILLTSFCYGAHREDVMVDGAKRIQINAAASATGIQSLDPTLRSRVNTAQPVSADQRNRIVLTAAVVPFSPTDLSGLEAWYKSGVGVTLNGGDVSQWDDSSGNGRNLTQGTAANQPLYNATDAAWNGLASISFNGTSDSLFANAVAVPMFQGTDKAYTIVTAVKRGAGGTYRFMMGSNDVAGGGTAQTVLAQMWNSVSEYVAYKRDSASSSVVSEIGTANGNAVIIRWQSSGTLAEVYVNGTSAGTSANDVGALTVQDVFCIGGFPTGTTTAGTWWLGDIAEVVMYSRLLTAGEQLQIEAYFKTKFATY